MIGIIDYGLGNIGSIVNMLDYLYLDSIVVDSPCESSAIDRYVLPGVGSFDRGMQGLALRGLDEFLHSEVVVRGKPLLGICLGMQLLTQRSEEGSLPGLGWVSASTVRLQPRGPEKIPNMGWRYVSIARENTLLPLGEDSRFYFVHSYGVQCQKEKDVVATVDFAQGFCACFEKENIFGVQFHPEKSHRFGLSLLQRYGTIKI